MNTNYLELINELIPIHQKAAGINPALHRLYPVVIAEGDKLLIHDCDEVQQSYRYIKSTPAPMPIPRGVRAAFQLEDYGGRIVCVLTPEVFDSKEGYVTILHEFVHCYQYETCEQSLKMNLDVARQAQEQGDFMWEIQHPFPYQSNMFTRSYEAFLEAVFLSDGVGDEQAVQCARQDLRSYLGRHDFEYMVWQEWKEGFARWVENRLQEKLGLCVNNGGTDLPFSRVTFYAGGAAYIGFLERRTPGLVNDLEALFSKMSTTVEFNQASSEINDKHHP